jgi:hypothetical protein
VEFFVVYDPDDITDLTEKVSIMRDDDTYSRKLLYHHRDTFFAEDVEMIGWLIHNDNVRFAEEHFGERNFCFFSSREGIDALLCFFCTH